MHAPFLDNILLGLTLQQAGGIGRIRAICKRVGFTEDQIAQLPQAEEKEDDQRKTHKDVVAWKAFLSETDCARLNLIRVLVANPEVLVMHKPTMYFSDSVREDMMSLLKEHVVQKGIELPEADKKWRRPRTVFFSAETAATLIYADEVYEVSGKTGVTRHDVQQIENQPLVALNPGDMTPSPKIMRSQMSNDRGGDD